MRLLRALVCVVSLMAIGCGGALTLNGITLLRYGPMNGGPAALTEGTLRIRDGCVSIEDPTAERSTVFWPPGTTLNLVGGRPAVVVGPVAASDGDLVTLGGGEYTDVNHRDFVEDLVGPLGACVSRQYWIATSMEMGGIDR